MATRSPIEIHGYWGNTYALATDLPNVAASPTQSSTLQVGDTAYVTSTQALYVCIDATLGAAIWSPMSTGLNAPRKLRNHVSRPGCFHDDLCR